MIVLTFKKSSRMEAACGLSITITMLMTTVLLYSYIANNRKKPLAAIMICGFFASLEFMFFYSSASKFLKGGYVAVAIALLIIFVMLIWIRSKEIKNKMQKSVHMSQYLSQLEKLQKDTSIPLTQTNIVYMVSSMDGDLIEQQYLYSILDKKPKKAKVYWFVNVEVTDEPFTQMYEVNTLNTKSVVFLKLYLGFRMPQYVNAYLRQVVGDLMKSGRIDYQPQKYSTIKDRNVGDFLFVFVDEIASHMSELTKFDRFILASKAFIRRIADSAQSWFGLDSSDVLIETVPLEFGRLIETKLVEKQANF